MTSEGSDLREDVEVGGDIASIQLHLQEVIEGKAFKGSRRSGQFLKHIVDQVVAGNIGSLKERLIGIEVFGRSPSYDTGEDAIVRVTASDVRKRLLQHYGGLDHPPDYRITLPPGSYVPKITHEIHRHHEDVEIEATPLHALDVAATAVRVESGAKRLLVWLFAGIVALNIGIWVVSWQHPSRPISDAAMSRPWSTLFSSRRSTQFITSDPNIAEIQGFTGGQISLSDYANHRYIPHPELLTPEQLKFCQVVLRGDKASVVDTPIAVNVAQLARDWSREITVHGARDIQITDLQAEGNIILLGSARSNPWLGLFEDHLDFRFDYDKTLASEVIRNVHPRPGESATYAPTAPGWATGESYAIVAFLQHPDQSGQVLVIAGENGEGTEAAGKLMTDAGRLKSTLKGCGISPTSTAQHFEVLLHLHTIAGSPSNVETVACHILK